jgi:SSS family transporter
MGLLNALDLTVIVSYLTGITWIGSRFYQKETNMKDYLLGSKVMRWFPVALSILAADTSAITYLGTPAWVFRHDMKLNQYIFAYLLAIPIVIFLFLPIYSKGNLYTAYQFLEHRFDLRVRLLASVFFLVVRGSHVAVIIYAPALIMSALMGIPLRVTILAMGLLTAFYTSLGGIKAVIWTDTIQVGTIILGFAVLATSALRNIPGGVHEVLFTGLAQGKFVLFDFSMNFAKVDNFWALLIGGTLVSVQAMSTDQAILQKYFTTKSSKESIKSLLFYGMTLIPLVTLLSLLGVVLFVFYSCHPELSATLHNPDAVVAHYAANMLPHGLAGLLVASIFAGSMSTVSASINALATSSVVDIYQRLFQCDRSDIHYTFASRCATVLWGLLATVGAFYANRLGTLALAFTTIQSLMGGVILGIFLLGVLSKRTTSMGAIVGSLFGFLIVVYVAFYTTISLYWYCVIGCITTLLIGRLYSQAFVHRKTE